MSKNIIRDLFLSLKSVGLQSGLVHVDFLESLILWLSLLLLFSLELVNSLAFLLVNLVDHFLLLSEELLVLLFVSLAFLAHLLQLSFSLKDLKLLLELLVVLLCGLSYQVPHLPDSPKVFLRHRVLSVREQLLGGDHLVQKLVVSEQQLRISQPEIFLLHGNVAESGFDVVSNHVFKVNQVIGRKARAAAFLWLDLFVVPQLLSFLDEVNAVLAESLLLVSLVQVIGVELVYYFIALKAVVHLLEHSLNLFVSWRVRGFRHHELLHLVIVDVQEVALLAKRVVLALEAVESLLQLLNSFETAVAVPPEIQLRFLLDVVHLLGGDLVLHQHRQIRPGNQSLLFLSSDLLLVRLTLLLLGLVELQLFLHVVQVLLDLLVVLLLLRVVVLPEDSLHQQVVVSVHFLLQQFSKDLQLLLVFDSRDFLYLQNLLDLRVLFLLSEDLLLLLYLPLLLSLPFSLKLSLLGPLALLLSQRLCGLSSEVHVVFVLEVVVVLELVDFLRELRVLSVDLLVVLFVLLEPLLVHYVVLQEPLFLILRRHRPELLGFLILYLLETLSDFLLSVFALLFLHEQILVRFS